MAAPRALAWPWGDDFRARTAAWVSASLPDHEPVEDGLCAGLEGASRASACSFLQFIVAARRDADHPCYELLLDASRDMDARLLSAAEVHAVLCADSTASATISRLGTGASATPMPIASNRSHVLLAAGFRPTKLLGDQQHCVQISSCPAELESLQLRQQNPSRLCQH